MTLLNTLVVDDYTTCAEEEGEEVRKAISTAFAGVSDEIARINTQKLDILIINSGFLFGATNASQNMFINQLNSSLQSAGRSEYCPKNKAFTSGGRIDEYSVKASIQEWLGIPNPELVYLSPRRIGGLSVVTYHLQNRKSSHLLQEMMAFTASEPEHI